MLVRRTSKNSVARLWLPPVANLLLILFIQHGCEVFSWVVPGMWFQVDALYLMFPLLYLRYAHALPQVVFTALALDAFWPGPYGTRLVIYLLIIVLMLPYRTRIRRENPFQIFMACAFMNLVIFSALWCVAAFSIGGNSSASVAREIMDMFFSSLLAGILSYGWTEFQRKMIIMVSDEDPAGYPILY